MSWATEDEDDDYPTYLEVVEDALSHGDEWAEAEAERIGLPALRAARRRCQAARWPEQRPDNCEWCAHLAETRGPV